MVRPPPSSPHSGAGEGTYKNIRERVEAFRSSVRCEYRARLISASWRTLLDHVKKNENTDHDGFPVVIVGLGVDHQAGRLVAYGRDLPGHRYLRVSSGLLPRFSSVQLESKSIRLTTARPLRQYTTV
jgi:hypothetical protein